MPNCIIHKKNIRLYEEPTTYRYDYIHYPVTVEKVNLSYVIKIILYNINIYIYFLEKFNKDTYFNSNKLY